MLSQLTDVKLKSVGMDNKDDRRLVLAAIRKAGYIFKKKSSESVSQNGSTGENTAIAGPSNSAQLNAVQVAVRICFLFLSKTECL